jgi:hypothetical protein
MAPKPQPSAYAKLLGGLVGDDFQDEVCERLRRLIADFQRIPAKPSGDGGLDGLSHGQTRAYCCYGPEQDPVKLKTKGDLKEEIVEKFRGDLRKLFEVEIGPTNRVAHAENKELATIIGTDTKIETIILIVSWFETHRVIGPINTAFTRYKKGSKLNYIAPNASVAIWGPKDLAGMGAVDEHTLFRIENRALLARVQAAGTAAIPPSATADFDAKFSYLKRQRPDLSAHIDALAADFRKAWAAAIALDDELASQSPRLHEALEDARTQAALSARLRSMGTTAAHELIETMRQDVMDRLGQSFGQSLGSLTSKIAAGEVARLIGDCPLEWRRSDA